ncbi:cation-translocating P-type ATPase [Silanimonas sp.]|uniref:cation-translocating P-type ATPase n=1 Tax=Silanimonas sp. TaxID=1929290 RepID=UPI0031B9F59F
MSTEEAEARLRRVGPNRLPEPPRKNAGTLLVEVLREPMFLLLVLAATLYLVLGDPAEGALLGLFAALSVGLVVVQAYRSERALDALRAMAAPVARVRRDGLVRSIPAAGLVPGDWIVVGEGERVPADAVLREGSAVRVDESLLTGESVPVVKQIALLGHDDPGLPGGEGGVGLFAGTLVVSGHGLAEVVCTGLRTQSGRIGASLASIVVEKTLLQQSMGRLVRVLGLMAGVVSVAVFLLHGLLRGEWMGGALSGIAVAMALLPEEFPMAFAVFMAFGAWRLAQLRILARRPAVIETLGAASVLCVDKTGTLTENRMRVRALLSPEGEAWIDAATREVPEAVHRLLEHAVLASRPDAVDPMDRAVRHAGDATLADTEHLHEDWPLARQYGLTAELLAYSQAWEKDEGGIIVATKGAPETIAGLCGLDATATAAMLAEVARLAAKGLRVLAVAHAGPFDAAPEDPRAVAFTFDGLVGFEDPLRPSAPQAIALARSAGIRVVMITGDFPATALAIAAQAGIDTAAGALPGAEIAALDDPALDAAVARVSVFARIRPEQKLRLVEAFKRRGEVVAMTGDGVNDAPALKAAHIGLAMAGGGTDVAREAAAISLLEDDIGHIVDGIRMGRRIFDNLRKVLLYVVAMHVPIAGLALLPVLLGWPPLLLPMHVVLVEMVVDPICAIAFESEPGERDLMMRPPRAAAAPLLGAPQLLLGALQGLFVLGGVLGLHVAAVARGIAEDEARTLAFIALTAGNFALVRINGARGPALPRLFERGHRAFWIVVAAATAIVATCVLWPAAATLFGFAPPGMPGTLVALGVGVGAAALFEPLKGWPPVRRALGG